MKNIQSLLIAVILMVFGAGNVIGQTSKTSEVDIKVSSQCSMCKETIERALAFEKGVVKSNLDLETHTVKVTYKNGKTDADQIRKAISLAGYDADDVPADPKSYAKLSDCCKKPDDRINKDAEHNH
jgi:periplasmic mercuric ion binding protein